MTPRQSARQHLPDLDQTFDELARRFGARLETLTTPDGTWGADPTADWPRLPATDLASSGAWQSPTRRTP